MTAGTSRAAMMERNELSRLVYSADENGSIFSPSSREKKSGRFAWAIVFNPDQCRDTLMHPAIIRAYRTESVGRRSLVVGLFLDDAIADHRGGR